MEPKPSSSVEPTLVGKKFRTFVVENVILKALYYAMQVVISFYTFVVENEGSVLCCESTN